MTLAPSLHLKRCATALVAVLLSVLPAYSGAAEPGEKIKLLVLDLELIGDLSDPSLAGEHEERIRNVSKLLREELAQLPRYEVVDATPAQQHIDSLRAVQYLHKCNGCEIDLALELGADQVMVAWVHRVSQLVLSLTYEIRQPRAAVRSNARRSIFVETMTQAGRAP